MRRRRALWASPKSGAGAPAPFETARAARDEIGRWMVFAAIGAFARRAAA